MIKALIFDLDNCLAAADEPGQQLFEPAFAAIRAANHGKLNEAQLQAAFADCWRHALDWVAAHHGFTKEMLEAGWKVLEKTEVKAPMSGYGDLAVLDDLPPAKLFLVTSGFRRLQESKIKALGIGGKFTEAIVDAIDQPNRKGKQTVFQEIVSRHSFTPEEVLIVGDNAESELAAGARLGIKTVQTLRPGVPRADNASFYVQGLAELQGLVAIIKDA